MEIIIRGEAKEIADLVRENQGRRDGNVRVTLDAKRVTQTLRPEIKYYRPGDGEDTVKYPVRYYRLGKKEESVGACAAICVSGEAAQDVMRMLRDAMIRENRRRKHRGDPMIRYSIERADDHSGTTT